MSSTITLIKEVPHDDAKARFDAILSSVAAARGISVSDIMRARRFHRLVSARRDVVLMAANEGFKPADIAKWLGKDRTTIWYIINKQKDFDNYIQCCTRYYNLPPAR